MAATTDCPRCLGCGQLANSEDREPWSVWENLPVKSAAAVLLGLVQPIPCDECGGSGKRSSKPGYVYVASSWKNPYHPAVCAVLKAAGIDHYDFRNPDGGTGFSWDQVDIPVIDGMADRDVYRKALDHPTAQAGFVADFAAMEKADTFVLVLPCGKSAHLELGWAVGAGKRTAILLEDPIQPELMYRMVDHLSPSVHELLGWLGVED